MPAKKRGYLFKVLKYIHGQTNIKLSEVKSQNWIKNLPPIERKSNGSLPRMTPSQRRRSNTLIRNVCSNYDEGNCIPLDDGGECICVQSISYSVRCKFFRHVVLEDKRGQSLKAEILRDDTTKRCTICRKTFQSSSNNAKYCSACAEDVLRKQKAQHARKRRDRKSVV